MKEGVPSSSAGERQHPVGVRQELAKAVAMEHADVSPDEVDVVVVAGLAATENVAASVAPPVAEDRVIDVFVADRPRLEANDPVAVEEARRQRKRERERAYYRRTHRGTKIARYVWVPDPPENFGDR